MAQYSLYKCKVFTSANGKKYEAPIESCGTMDEKQLLKYVRGYKATVKNERTIIYKRWFSKVFYEAVIVE